MKKILAILTMIMIAAAPCAAFAEEAVPGNDDVIILYTNDVHCAIDDYAELAAYRAQLIADGYEVITVDAGDAVQGGAIGTLTNGSAVVDMMNTVGYDYAVPGNHEYDYGMDVFLDLAEKEARFEYLSCNFVDLRTGELVLSPWDMISVNGEEIAFLGIATPESYSKSTPAYFQDGNGNDIYGFSENEFYDVIQDSVDSAIDAGADRVVAVGHLGISGTAEGWKSTDVIENTVGIDAFIDAHSHEVIEEYVAVNEAGEPVVLSSTGSKFQYFGQMTLGSNGSEDARLIAPETVDINSSAAANEAYSKVRDKADGYNDDVAELEEIIGDSEVELTLNDPDTGQWVIRTAETNMGDFVADAYRSVSGADVALVNSGGIRAAVNAGEVTRKELMDVNPWNNRMCVVRATGQQILDALEFGARMYPAECGGFLQVSGLTYEIQSWRPSPVIVDEKGGFLEVNEAYPRRVTNVTIGGVPLEADGIYTVIASNYLLKEGGDGFNMFADAEVVEYESLPLDSEMLMQYLEDDLKGVVSAAQYGDLKGAGRIMVIKEENQIPENIPGDTSEDNVKDESQQLDQSTGNSDAEIEEDISGPQTGDDFDNIAAVCLMIAGAAAAGIAVRRKRI